MIRGNGDVEIMFNEDHVNVAKNKIITEEISKDYNVKAFSKTIKK